MKSDKSDITRNIRIIEWLKVEILNSISMIYNLIFKGADLSDVIIKDALANLIMMTYLLGKRLGINFNDIDNKINEKINDAISEEHQIEKWYNDLSNLKRYIKYRE